MLNLINANSQISMLVLWKSTLRSSSFMIKRMKVENANKKNLVIEILETYTPLK